jgi:hypothetical protein
MSLPSLNLSFEKHHSASTSMSSANDNSARNNVTLNIINPLSVLGEPYSAPVSPRPCSAYPSAGSEPQSPVSVRNEPTLVRKPTARAWGAEEEGPKAYQSPAFPDIEQEFKDQLLSFTTDLLLRDFDLLKNIAERGNKILFHLDQLKMLIAILYLNSDDRKKYDSLIDIETEKIISTNCFCKECCNPFYEKIKNIHVNKQVNFLTTPFAVNMQTTFRISLDFCLSG